MAQFCPDCGSRLLKTTAKFCQDCGARLGVEPAHPVPVAEARTLVMPRSPVSPPSDPAALPDMERVPVRQVTPAPLSAPFDEGELVQLHQDGVAAPCRVLHCSGARARVRLLDDSEVVVPVSSLSKLGADDDSEEPGAVEALLDGMSALFEPRADDDDVSGSVTSKSDRPLQRVETSQSAVLYDGPPSHLSYWWAYLIGVPLLAVKGFGVVVLAGAAIAVMAQRWRITSSFVEHRRGLISRDIDTVELWRVRDVRFRQGPVERILGLGTIELDTTHPTRPVWALKGLGSTFSVYKRLLGAVERAKRSDSVQRHEW